MWARGFVLKRPLTSLLYRKAGSNPGDLLCETEGSWHNDGHIMFCMIHSVCSIKLYGRIPTDSVPLEWAVCGGNTDALGLEH
jgi:hypothetical protein